MTIITANQRLAKHLCRQHQLGQQIPVETAHESLDCLPLSHWIARTYQTLPDAVELLTETQELWLWEWVIAESFTDMQDEVALLSPRALAKTAMEAWHTLQRWKVPLSTLANATSKEVQMFLEWTKAFLQQCRLQQSIDVSTATTQLIQALSAHTITLPKHFTIAGFEEVPPQTQRLFDAIAMHGQLQIYKPAITDATLQRVGLKDTEQELLAMTHWAHALWQQHPTARIGCVVPDLIMMRNTVERMFKQLFVSLDSTENSKSKIPFNIAGGTPLSRFPLIQSAFDLLKLAMPELDAALVSRWLRSPFWGGAEQELVARATLDARLRDTREAYFHWPTIMTYAQQQGDCDLLLQLVQAWQATLKTSSRQYAHAWAEHFNQQLQAIGWPGERTLNSTEYQQQLRWQDLLTEFGQLDKMQRQPLSAAQAWQALFNLAQDTLFQPQTADAPIQVLGILETVGLTFDYLWICGMTQENWPRPPAPNPFIPLALQRRHHMPHASTERELIYCQGLTAHLCQRAPQVLFSYALQQQDQAQTPSALIRHIQEISLTAILPDKSLEAIPYSVIASGKQDALNFEYYSDEQGPSLQPEEVLRGGASLFRHQAACAFRAFAKVRLGVQELPGCASAITLPERGMYLHDILEKIWRKITDHTTLCNYESSALTELIGQIVDQVLARYAAQRPFALKPQYLALERKRLIRLVEKWLEMEKQRPPFRVSAIEAKRNIQFAGLTLKLRLDREDELADGTRLVIDYKTGICHIAQWFGERPDDPQLPLYGMTGAPAAQGLMFAQLNADKLQFKGISAGDYGIPGVQPIDGQKQDMTINNWQDFYTAQQRVLTNLAEEFKNGYAKVNPKNPQTCRQCDLRLLCRVDRGKTR